MTNPISLPSVEKPRGQTTLGVNLENLKAALAAMDRVRDRAGDTPDAKVVDAFLQRIAEAGDPLTFQADVDKWVLECFGQAIRDSIPERCHRLFEEATETVQSLGATREECHMLVDYVFDRPPGDPFQEVGGLLVCIAALCNASSIDMHWAAGVELHRIWGLIDKIRQKQKTKPASSPLPGVVPTDVPTGES